MLLRGLAAGAAGTAVLNFATYVDMFVRARSAGYVTGMGLGAAYGLVVARRRRPPTALGAIGLASAAMALADVPATAVGATDPRRWGVAGWLADLVPHLVYGGVTATVHRALARCSR